MLRLLLLVTSVGAFDKNVFVKQMHDVYNDARRAHNVPTVSLNRQASTRASIWAQYLSIVPAQKCLRHSKEGGQNLYFFWTSRPISENLLARKCAQAFYEEIKYYNYANPGFIHPAAHFTEMVWKDVREIGIAVHIRKYTNRHGGCATAGTSRRPVTGYMVVIQHNPKGNRTSRRQFLMNVLRPVRKLRFI